METKVNLFIVTLLSILLYGCNIKPLSPKLSEDDVIKTTVKVLSAFEFKVNHMDEVDLKREVENICKDWGRTNNDSAFLCKISEDLTCQIFPLETNGEVHLRLTFFSKNIALGRAESVALYNRVRALALESSLISANEIYNGFWSHPYGYFYKTTGIKTNEEIYDNGIEYICSYYEPQERSYLEENNVINYGELPKTVAIKGLEFARSMEILMSAFSFNKRESIDARISNLSGTEKYLIEYVLPMGDDDNAVDYEEFNIFVDLCKIQTDKEGVKTYFYAGKDLEDIDYVVSTLNKTLKEMYKETTGSDEEYAFRVQNQYGLDELFVPVINGGLLRNKSSTASCKGIIDDPDGYTNIRKSNSVKSEIIGKIVDGEVFTYWETNDNWYIVQTESGMRGYVHKSRIKPVEERDEQKIRYYKVKNGQDIAGKTMGCYRHRL